MLAFNDDRIVEVSRHLITEWQARRGAFRGLVPPEEKYLPERLVRGSLEHAQLLFFLGWLTRMGNSSDKSIRDAVNLVLEHPRLIDPNNAYSDDRVMKLIASVVSFPEHDPTRLRGWPANLARMREQYAGDPLNIFLQHGTSRQTLITAWSEFSGIREKLAQMLTVWFQSVDWPEHKDWRHIKSIVVFPVDIHVMRLYRMLDLVASWDKDHHHALANLISDHQVGLMVRHRLDHIACSQAFWHLGAVVHRSMPRDLNEAAPYCQACPADTFCNWIVRSEQYKRNGKIGWDTVIKRPHTLFRQP